MAIRLFGYKFEKDVDEDAVIRSFVPPDTEEGVREVSYISYGGSSATFQVDIDGSTKTESDLINKYREIANLADVDGAIEQIISEMIVSDEASDPVQLLFDDDSDHDAVTISDKLKNQIIAEFSIIMGLLNFKSRGHDIVKRWYVDGRIYYHMLIDENNPREGIQEFRFIDPRKIRKIREMKQTNYKDPEFNVTSKQEFVEYYIYSDMFYAGMQDTPNMSEVNGTKNTIRVATDAIATANSGLIDAKTNIVLSYLNKAIRPANMLNQIENAYLIYKLTRAPERRIFYVDVQDLPRARAEQHLKAVIDRFRNKLSYDPETGEIREQKRIMSIIDDFFIPRRNGTSGTQIDTLGGDTSGFDNMDGPQYFKKNLYKSLNVPIGRLDPQEGFSIGRSNEVSREEVMFSNFVTRLRSRFASLFDKMLSTQLILKGYITDAEWEEIRGLIHYDFLKDNFFSELKDAEILRERLNTLAQIEQYQDRYYTHDWILDNVLHLTEKQKQELKRRQDDIKKKYPGYDPTRPPEQQGLQYQNPLGNGGMPGLGADGNPAPNPFQTPEIQQYAQDQQAQDEEANNNNKNEHVIDIHDKMLTESMNRLVKSLMEDPLKPSSKLDGEF